MGAESLNIDDFAQAVKGYPAIVAVLIGLTVGLVFGVFNGVCIAYLKVPAFVGT